MQCSGFRVSGVRKICFWCWAPGSRSNLSGVEVALFRGGVQALGICGSLLDLLDRAPHESIEVHRVEQHLRRTSRRQDGTASRMHDLKIVSHTDVAHCLTFQGVRGGLPFE